MNKTITTEQEGVLESVRLANIQDYLCNIAEISINAEDFVQKVGYGLTDETVGLSQEDNHTLEDWYYQTYLLG